MIGQTILHYTILEKLGEGGMGVVYKARDTRLERDVALKFLPAALAASEEELGRFEQEARAISTLNHPTIATIHDVGEFEGRKYIVLEYIPGGTLKSELKRIKAEGGEFPLSLVLDYAIQIAEGLSHAHRHGIVHRDVKPDNMMLTEEGKIKLTDFGLAKLRGSMQLTRTGTTIGTAAYMSPEQARGEEIDQRTDIWSFGVVLYEMLTRSLPFQGEFEASLMYSIVNEPPPPMAPLRGDLPAELEAVVLKALEKDRTKRYQDMGEVAAELAAIKKNLDAGITGTISRELATRYVKAYVKGHRSLVWAVSAAVLLGASFLLVRPLLFKSGAASQNRAIAVLPLTNLGDSANAYYAAGFTDDLTGMLSKVPEAVVISARSTPAFIGALPNDSAVASELGARFLLRGDLQLSVARIKVHALIFDAEEGGKAWEQTFEGYRSEVLAIRRKIIGEIAGFILPGYDPSRLSKRDPSVEAYEATLTGNFYRDKQTKEGHTIAREYFLKAVGLDSSYVQAMTALAATDVDLKLQGWDRSESLLTEAEYLCRRTLAADTASADCYAVLGFIADLRGKRDDAIRLLHKALDIQKNHEVALTGLGIIYTLEVNEPAKALVCLKQLVELKPTDWLLNVNLGVGYGQIKNYPEALKYFYRALRLNPSHAYPPNGLGYTFERMGKIDSAVRYYSLALENNPRDPRMYDNLVCVLLASGRSASAESVLTRGMRQLPGDYMLLYDLGVASSLGGKRQAGSGSFTSGLKVVEGKLLKTPDVGDLHVYAGLFHARLGATAQALEEASSAARLDSANEDVAIKIARVYSILGKKEKMLEWFRRAKSMNPEYDTPFLVTAMDFDKYRKDPDLLALAGQE